MNIKDKIKLLRELMKVNDIDAYIVPSTDSHQSEYIPDHFKSREWISGFTGSAGTIVVSKESAILWTDGRYFLQAEQELKGSEIDLFKLGEEGFPSVDEYLQETLRPCQTLGFDGKLFSQERVAKIKKELKSKDIKIKSEKDLIDEIWKDRPPLPKGQVFYHEEKYTGMSIGEKISKIREEMKTQKSDYYLISSLGDIAWTFNIRSNDINYTPVVISYALIGMESVSLFIDKEKLNKNIKRLLEDENIKIKPYEHIDKALSSLPTEKIIYIDTSKISAYCYENIPKDMKKIVGRDIVEKIKTKKNKIEIENFKRCQLRDGVAMVKFLHWLDINIGKCEITELSASKKLEEIRAKGKNYVSLSFETIAGYKEHGAIVHYSVNEKSDYKLKAEGMLLLDSGAQYLDGTTDITRTIVLGPISEEEKRNFSLVLKGHIALSRARFLYGTTGTQLDILARQALWNEGKDYKHGTGHGVGYLLSVHEGAERISQVPTSIKLEDGMLITNEPGFYKSGEYGIRTENIMLVKEEQESPCGKFMKFETMTLCPIDLKGIDTSILDHEEKKWLNDYHKRVRESLSEYLNKEEREWLNLNTREI